MAFGDVVQSNTGTSTSATTSPTLGSGVTAGNLVVLQFAADDYNGSPNAGWTQSTGMEQQVYHGGYLWWFIAGSNGQTIPSYTVASAVRSAWTLVEYEGPFHATPLDVSNGQSATSSAVSYTTPAITPASGSRLLIAGINFQQSSPDIAAPLSTSWTNSFTQVTGFVYNGGNPRLSLGQARRLVTADGSTSYSTGVTMDTTQVAGSESGLIIAFVSGGGGGTNATATPSTVAAATTIGTPTVTVQVSRTVTPAAVAATATIGAPTLSTSGNATVTPSTVLATVTIDSVSGAIAETVTPSTVAGSTTVGSPSVQTAGNVTVNPVTVTATVTVGAPTVSAGSNATVSPSTVAAVAGVGAPAVTGPSNATVGASTVSCSVTVGSPTLVADLSVTVTPTTVTATVSVGAPTVSTVEPTHQFTPPSRTYRTGTHPLWGRMVHTVGQAVVVYESGAVVELANVAPSIDGTTVTAVYDSGRTYEITAEQAAVLEAAGYGEYLEGVT